MSGIILRTRVSDGARALATASGFRLQSLRTPSRVRRGTRLQVNWGSASPRPVPNVRCLNSGAAVELASNKLSALIAMREAGVPVPDFWQTKEEVNRRENGLIFARTLLRASEGRGIVVVRPGEDLPQAPLYVQYIRKSTEYRVHVGGTEVIAIQQKRFRNDHEASADERIIRNHRNGWIFAVENVVYPTADTEERLREAAVAAVRALGLDFGAVDLVVGKTNRANVYVLEVNTAPGLSSPTTLRAYTEYLTRTHAEQGAS